MPTYSTDLDRELEEMARRELNGDKHALTAPVGIPGRLDSDDARFPQEDKNIAVGVHLGSLIAMFMSGTTLTWAIPLIAHFVVGDRSEPLKQHVRSQLNFQITMVLVMLVGIIGSLATFGFGFFIAAPVMLMYVLAAIWGGIRGAMAANNGEEYEYPFAYPFIK